LKGRLYWETSAGAVSTVVNFDSSTCSFPVTGA